MNRMTLRILVSKSPWPIFGRYLTSFTDTLVDFFRASLAFWRLFVLELAVIHDPANRRVGVRGHFDEVEFETSRHPQRIGDRFDSELVAGRVR